MQIKNKSKLKGLSPAQYRIQPLKTT